MAHTLTFKTHSDLKIRVNNKEITSPYTLKNDDVITATTEGTFAIIINGNIYISTKTLDLQNIDINISISTRAGSGTVTINYTETGGANL